MTDYRARPMNVYLIRHAHAGHRSSDSHDIYRQLSPKGIKQAEHLIDVFDGLPIGPILSSTATRCVQTVEPLAAQRGLEVHECEELWEDSRAKDALDLIAEHLADGLVASSHGNIIPEVLEKLAKKGVPLDGRGCEKGSVWLLEHDGKDFTRGRYLSKKALHLPPVMGN